MKQHLVTLWHYPHFLKLWAAQFFIKNAENLLHFFFVLYLYDQTQNSFLVSVLVVGYSLPPIFFSSFGGVVADSFDRRKIFLVVNGLRILLLFLAYGISENPTGIILAALLLSIVGEFFGPAHNASIPSVIDHQHLYLGNTISTLTAYAGFLIGFSLAGPILYYFGKDSIFLLAFFFMLIGLLTQATLPKLDHHLRNENAAPRANFKWSLPFGHVLERIREGVGFIRQHPLLMLVIFQAAFSFTIERAFVSLMPGFSEQLLNFTPKDISYFLIIPTGVGAIIGAMLANILQHKIHKPYIINAGIILNGVGLFFVGLYPWVSAWLPTGVVVGGFGLFSLIYVWLLAVASGIADPFVIVTTQTLIQERTPAATRGRVFGSLVTLMNLLGILPIIAIGWLAQRWTIQTVVFSLGGATLFVAILGGLFYGKLRWTEAHYDASDFVKT